MCSSDLFPSHDIRAYQEDLDALGITYPQYLVLMVLWEKEGILKGMYLYQQGKASKKELTANLLGSGTIMNETLKAAEILQEKYGVSANVYSVTSYKELHRDALEVERHNLLHPDKEKTAYVSTLIQNDGVIVAASDYL